MDHFTEEKLPVLPEKINASMQLPFSMIVAGPSGAGKSTLVSGMLDPNKHTLFSEEFTFVKIFVGTKMENNSMAMDIKNKLGSRCMIFDQIDAENCSSIIERETNNVSLDKGLFIIDDLMVEAGNSGVLNPLFTKVSSHYGLSIIFITQNLFQKSRNNDNATLYRNAGYIVIFSSPLDNTTADIIARRLKPTGFRTLSRMLLQECTKHRYIMIDGRQSTDERIRYRTDILSERDSVVAYQRVFVLRND
jgi:hypothetical protein